MRSDVRIGIAIGLVIILGVVVYFIFSNRPDKPSEQVAKTQPAPPQPWKIEIAKGPLGRQVTPAPGDKPREGTIDGLVAGTVDKTKAPVGVTPMPPVAPVGPIKIEPAPVGPGKAGDIWAVKPDVKPAPTADPVEAKMRKDFESDGAVSMRGGAPEPADNRDAGAAAVGNIERLLASAGSDVIKPEAAVKREPWRLEPAKVEPPKVEPPKIAPPKTGPDDTIGNIMRDEAAKVPDNASEAVRKGEYIVKPGDKGGSWSVAKNAYGDSKLAWFVEKSNNGIDWKKLKPGDKVKTPPPPAKALPAVAPVSNGLGLGGPAVADASKYTVKADDNGEKISKAVYGESKYWSLISKANGDLDARKLKVGAVLTIPPKPAPAASTGTGPTGPAGLTGVTPPTSGDTSKYTVKEGDNGEKISKSVYGSTKYWSLIEDANKGLNARRLKVGQVLTIPPKPAGATGPTTGTSARATTGEAPVVGKAAARRAAAAKALASEKNTTEKIAAPKKPAAKKPVSEPISGGETDSTEREPASAGSGGGNGFD
ncbi:MAG: LysM peptidoglycan-binding domain-containing protein [Planctomycetota bacterium]|nr:LysM peptidoglycan-binding domain-containing protein [Planctomycetota bacterium]